MMLKAEMSNIFTRETQRKKELQLLCKGKAFLLLCVSVFSGLHVHALHLLVGLSDTSPTQDT